jgi:uncharacterized membrane protein (DUF2068 family)
MSTQSQPLEGKTMPERPWMVKIAAFMAAGAALQTWLGMCAEFARSHNTDISPSVLVAAAMIYMLHGAFQLLVAWGLWNLKKLARWGFVVVVAIDMMTFVCNLPTLANGSAAIFIVALIGGLAFRGYFIYWFVGNKQYFTA